MNKNDNGLWRKRVLVGASVRVIFLLTVILLLACVTGCSTVGKMPVEIEDAALALEPEEDEALVYIVRPSGMGSGVRIKTWCDGEYLGATGGGRFIFTHQDAGPHLFASKAENTSELQIELEGGRTYYLEHQIKLGVVQARANMVLLDEEEGREKLRKCSLSDDIVDVIPGSEEYMNEMRRKRIEEEEAKKRSQEFGLN